MDISVVVPLYNEVESLPELNFWIDQVMVAGGFTYEIWFIDDGSIDGSWRWIEEQSKISPAVKGIRFRRNYGKSAALHTGFEAANGDVVIALASVDRQPAGDQQGARRAGRGDKHVIITIPESHFDGRLGGDVEAVADRDTVEDEIGGAAIIINAPLPGRGQIIDINDVVGGVTRDGENAASRGQDDRSGRRKTRF